MDLEDQIQFDHIQVWNQLNRIQEYGCVCNLDGSWISAV